ncbi:putative MscS family protein YhdY [Pullulanibacillus camelliae]|uniref:Putative MscS family protein YhdY n=1 Tax=Pullulanibacillus camelliae TaxID=1707096 RepID=A0A8J2YCN8_9BACL|nr:mechanosensitive ion channel family protein [Pullulanibacillus camelliae]GGE37668.1 putative MscS family protein YhdY [Pullulanibacillus camelliae]
MTQDILDWAGHLTWKDGLISFIILMIFLFLGKPLTSLIIKILTHFTKRTRNTFDDDLIKAINRPLYFLIALSGLYLSFKYLAFPASAAHVIGHLYRTAIVICIGVALFQLTNSTEKLFGHFSHKLNLQFDRIVIPFITKILKFIVFALMLTMILSEWGYSINGFVAGLGLAGLAISLAAKDTVSNLFGGFIIITETPFTIGDWVQTPSVEGTIEDISFRSTKVRTFADALVTIPNSTLANEAIINWSRMEKRQLTFNIELDIRTPRQQIERCLTDIRAYLKQNEAVHQEAIYVYLQEMNTTGFNILLYFFTTTTVWKEWLNIREQINLNILKILEAHHVQLAVPGRTVFYHEENPNQEHFERSPQ